LAPTTIQRMYEVAAGGRPDEVDSFLQSFSAAERLNDPGAMALRGVKNVLQGDVPGGIALLRRAVDHAPADSRAYIVDLLVPLLVSIGDFRNGGEALDSIVSVPPELVPMIASARAVVAAHGGDDEASRAFADEALAAGRGLDNPLFTGRVLQRVALTAFYREDWHAAQDLATEAARAYEAVKSHRHAANAYTILYSIAHAWLGDPDLANFYAEKIAIAGKAAGDLSMQNLGLVAQMEIAAEAGLTQRLSSIRGRLMSNRLNEQYTERFAFVLAEVLSHGWQGNFETARAMAAGALRDERLSRGERATCEALLALLAVAAWNLDDVRKYARLAIAHSTEWGGPEALYERRRRRTARIIAAAACILGGEPSRGRRALSPVFDPDAQIARLLSAMGIDEAQSPALLRGYARLGNGAYAASLRNRPQHGLTQAEMRVLRVLPSGSTIASIASSFGKSQKTVQAQLTSIYTKLEAKNRAQAIERARELGIYA
jgi:DNA-binding CsgD family transcriptional regulator